MRLSEHEIAIVRQSFRDAMALRERFQLDFYEAFFRRAPETRQMFRHDISGQGMRFMTTMQTIVNNVGAADLPKKLADLGHAHAALGVHVEHFAPMGEALVETLARTLGENYREEIGDAWRKAFDEIAQAMIVAGGMDRAGTGRTGVS